MHTYNLHDQVDFFWINRDQKSFEWFISLLSKLEIQQSEHGGFDRFLEMHMYMTSALSKTDMKAIGLQMALDLIHKKEKRDLITGLKTRTQAGRPDWDKVYGGGVCVCGEGVWVWGVGVCGGGVWVWGLMMGVLGVGSHDGCVRGGFS